jgi:hypothetical protein
MEMGQMSYDLLGWFVFFIGGVIGGALMRSRKIGRLEADCYNLRRSANNRLQIMNSLERELRDERRGRAPTKPDCINLLDGLRFRIRGIRGLPDSKVFVLRKR